MCKITKQHIIIFIVILFSIVIIFKNDITRLLTSLMSVEQFYQCPISTNAQISFQNYNFNIV